ncbi:MAG: antibiotic biosynthesis monooxygenase [Mycobacterium sp.]|nr:antibiotic biosynthesis monooxygenase [Mycobacterium sp.]
MTATALVLLHPSPGDRLNTWFDRVREVAATMPGFVALRLGHTGGELATAAAITFDSADHLAAWLDSPFHEEAFTDANALGVLRKSSVLLLGDGGRLPPGTAVFRHDVIASRTESFISAELEIAAATSSMPGFDSLVLLPPLPGHQQWASILAFHTDDQLAAWLASSERAERVPVLRAQLTKDFSIDAPFGSILRMQDGRPRVTPRWRTAMLIVLVLYPTAMTVTRFVAPLWVELGAHPWLSTWLTQVLCVGAMTYALMPFATRKFSRWLDPVAGSSLRVSLVGASIVLAVYAVWLLLFAWVPWLALPHHP